MSNNTVMPAADALDALVVTEEMAVSDFEKEYARVVRLDDDTLINNIKGRMNTAYAELTALMEKSLKNYFYNRSFDKVNSVLSKLQGFPCASKFAQEFILRATTKGIDVDGREGAVKLLAPEKEWLYSSGLTIECVKGVEVKDIASFNDAKEAFMHTRGVMFGTLRKKSVRKEWDVRTYADLIKAIKAGDKEPALSDDAKKALELLKQAAELLK